MKASTSKHLKLLVPRGYMGNIVMGSLQEKGLYFEKAALRTLYYTGVSLTIDIILLKSSNIITYMDQGLTDYAIVGEDMLGESLMVYRHIAPLKMCECYMSLAGYPDFQQSHQKYVHITSKYPVQAASVLVSLGICSEIITLASSVELVSILDFADVILDIVETGSTLRDNYFVEWISDKPIRSALVGRENQSADGLASNLLRTLIDALPLKELEVGYALCS